VNTRTSSSSLRLPATLLLAGQLLYILITQLHTGGDANHHPSVFAEYAHSGTWGLVHLGQFAAVAILLAGLLALYSALDLPTPAARWAGRYGAASAAVALALYGALQAVDGVALKQAVTAWANAPEAEKAARFASAEAIRWLEWGMRSYQDYVTGVALLLFAAAVIGSSRLPRPIGHLMGLSGLAYLAQGWVAGSQGFSEAQSIAIVLAWILDLAWMIWLVLLSRRTRERVAQLA
jgi:hypothetical protein